MTKDPTLAPANVPPDGYMDELRELEEELLAGDITKQGFDKRKAKLDIKWEIHIGNDDRSNLNSERPKDDGMHPTMMLMSVVDTGNVEPKGNGDQTLVHPQEVTEAELASVVLAAEALNVQTVETDSSFQDTSSTTSTSSMRSTESPTSYASTYQQNLPAHALKPTGARPHMNAYHSGSQPPYQPHYHPTLPGPNRFPPPLYPGHAPSYHYGMHQPYYPVAPPQPSPILHRPASMHMTSTFAMPSVLRSQSNSDVTGDNGPVAGLTRSSSSSNLDQMSRQAGGRLPAATLARSGSSDAIVDQSFDPYGNRFMRPLSVPAAIPPNPILQPPQFMPPPSPPRNSNGHRRISVTPDQADSYMKSIMPFLNKQMSPTKPRELPAEVNDDISGTPMIRFGTIAAIVRFRAKSTPKALAFTSLDSKGREIASITYERLHSRAEKIAMQFAEKPGLTRGENILLIYKRLEFVEFMVALIACFYAGMVAVPLVTSSTVLEDEITEALFIIENCRISVALTTDATAKSLAKDFVTARGGIPKIDFWKTNESLLANNKLFSGLGKGLHSPFSASSTPKDDDLAAIARPDELAYVEYTKNAVGELKGVLMDHQTIFNHSYVFKGSNDIVPSDTILLQLEPRQQFGFLASFVSLFAGSHVILVPETSSDSICCWNFAVAKYKATVAMSDNACMVEVSNFIRESQKKQTTELSSLRLVLIDSCIPHNDHIQHVLVSLKENGFRDGANVVPIATVSELGGVCLATNDALGKRDDATKGANKDAVTIRLDQQALAESRVEIVSPGSVEQGKTPLEICDAGYLFHGVSLLIVEPESKLVLPKNCIGEIFVNSPATFPKGFWALPKLSEQTFRVHPVMYRETENVAWSAGNNAFHNHRRASSFGVVAESLDNSDFVRTGLFGFLLDDSALPGVGTPRLFVTGIRRDLIKQKRTAKEIAALDSRPASQLVLAKEHRLHMSSDLVETCFREVSGIESCAIFSVSASSEHLPIIIVDTFKQKESLPSMAVQIAAVLESRHELKPYCIAFSMTNAMPKLKPDPMTGTGLQTTFAGYSAGVVTTRHTESKPQFSYSGILAPNGSICRKLTLVDVELCRTTFLSGDLQLKYVHLNSSSTMAKSILSLPSEDASKESEIIIPGRGHAPLKVGQVVGGIVDVPVLDDQTLVDLNSFSTISHLLRYRSDLNGDKPAFITVDHKGRESKVVSFRKFSNKVHSLAHYLTQKRGLKAGDYILVVYPPGLDYVYCLHACLYAGIIPIPLSPPDLNRLKEDIPAMLQLASEFGVKDLLCNSSVEELLRSRAAQIMVKAVIQQQQAVDQNEDVHTSGMSLKSSSSSIASTSSPKRSTLYLPQLVNTSRVPKLGLPMSNDDPVFCYAKLSPNSPTSPASKSSHRNSTSTLSRLRKSANGQPSPTAMVLVNTNPDLLRTVTRISHATLLEQCRLQAIHGRILESCRPAPNTPGSPYMPELSTEGSMNRPLISCIWFESIHRYQVKDAFATYPMLEHALTVMQDYKSFSLQSIKSLAISTEGRNRPSLHRAIMKTFIANQLEQSAISTTYSASVNPMISSRGYMTNDLTSLYLDLKALRRGKIQVMRETRGESREDNKDKSTIMLQDSGRIPNNTIVAIVHPTTRKLCSPNEMGEIWVCSPGNIDNIEYDDVHAGMVGAIQSHNPNGTPTSPLNGRDSPVTDLASTVEGVDPNITFARTGDVGFLWPVSIDASGGDDVISLRRRRRSSGLSGSEDFARSGGGNGWERLVLSGAPYEMVLFVVGSLAETIEINGLKHFPIDVEKTVENCHKIVAPEGCVIFKSGNGEIVCVVECMTDSKPAILALVPRLVTIVLEEHQFFLDVVCFVRQGHLARSRLQEKQRNRIKLAYHLGKLPMIEVFKTSGSERIRILNSAILSIRTMSTKPMPTSEKMVLAVVGTTGVGKSNLSIELAKRFGGEVINADSMQVYRGLDIVTNKVTPEEQSMAPHHLLSFVDPPNEYSVSQFEIEEIHSRGRIPVLVGGTHYYIQAILWHSTLIRSKEKGEEGEEDVEEGRPHPSIPAELAARIGAALEKSARSDVEGWDGIVVELGDMLKEVDPVMGARWHEKDWRRIRRSLEIFYQRGERQSDIIELQKTENLVLPRFRSMVFWIWSDPAPLDVRLDSRVDAMIQMGLFHELETMKKKLPSSTPDYTRGILQAIGFKEFAPLFDLALSDETYEGTKVQCVENMKAATRRYARRQVTWIKNKMGPRCLEQGIPIIALDASDLAKWHENVKDKAFDIVQEFFKTPKSPPLTTPLTQTLIPKTPSQDNDSDSDSDATTSEKWISHTCDVCIDARTNAPKVLHGEREWSIHLASSRHRRKVRGMRESEVWKGRKEEAERKKGKDGKGSDSGGDNDDERLGGVGGFE
ncbi:hypothetical protein HDU97_006647 [Phlyctochytrium planicorne]|nr:hypothetical protein HDU97_006647 [Phlyctochytrium planicorne]